MSDAARIDEFDTKNSYTYADYLTWEGPERYELINGQSYMMASPSVVHQAILVELTLQFGNWLQGKPCKVFPAPLDVRLFPKSDKSDETVVQPDLLVVCDKDKISKNSIDGAPDLVVEILSPSNIEKYLLLKFHYYLKAGVREYWVIDPKGKTVYVHCYDNERFDSTMYKENDCVPVDVLPGLKIDFKEIWERIGI